MKKLPKSIVDAVAQKARNEYDFSITTVQRKRAYFRREYPRILNIGSENKIYERLIFRSVDMMCALSHKFRPNITFQKRLEDDQEAIRYLELVKEFDYDEMDLAMKKYRVHWYKFVFGVGIEVEDTFNKFTATPQIKVVNPMCRVPDLGFGPNTGFRYHGFELEVTKEELEGLPDFYSLDNMKDMNEMNNGRNDEEQQNYLASIQNRQLNEVPSLPKGVFAVYQHRTYYKGNAYEIWLANDRTLPIYCRWIKPVLEEEKKDKGCVGLGVNVRHYRPLPNDPYGVSFAFDLLGDKQRQIQVYHNLNLITAKYQALGDKYMYNPEVVTAENVDILKKAFEQPVFIPVPGLGTTLNGDAVVEMKKPQLNTSSFEFAPMLKDIAGQDISMDDRTMGVSAGPKITKGESERVQLNANVRLLLGANFDLQAEKEFYRMLWYRPYIENRRHVRNKFVELANGVEVVPLLLKADDFLTKTDPRIKASSTLDAEEEREKKRLSLLAVYSTLRQSVSSQFGAKKLDKYLADLHGLEREMQDIMFGQSPEEMQARADLALINRGIVPKVNDLTEDHDVYIDIYNTSSNTETKIKAIQNRQLAKMAKQQMMGEQTTPQQTTLQPGVENQAMAQSMNESREQATSLQDVG